MSNGLTERKANLREWLAIGLLLFYSGSAYAASVNSFYASLKYILIIGIAGIYLIKSKGKIPVVKKNRKLAFWIPVVWCCLCFVNWILHNNENLSILISRLLHVIFAYEIVCIISWENFKEKYVKSIVIVSIISLIFYFFIANTSIYSAVMPKLWGYTEYGQLYMKYQGFLIYFKTGDMRNYGAFWEPGIFATHIICAFLMMPYTVIGNKNKVLMYVILGITLVTTSSSAGYVLFIMAIVCNIIGVLKIKKQRDYFKLVFVFILLGLLLTAYLNLDSILNILSLENEPVFRKILYATESERSESVRVNLEAFFEKPIFGFGFSNLEQAEAYRILGNTTSVLNTATTFRLLAALGISGSFFTIILVSGFLKNKKILWYVKLVLIIIMLIIINKEGHDSFLLAWCLAMYLNEREWNKEKGVC